MRWFYLPLNPEPWAVGSLSLGKRNGRFFPKMDRNPQLAAYKEAIAEELSNTDMLPPGEYELRFYFWRVLDDYETGSGKRHRKHAADTTNLQKATEDALQGILFDNDRHVQRVTSTIIAQGPEVKPGILIGADNWSGLDPDELPQSVWDLVDERGADEMLPFGREESTNDWTGPEDFF